MILVDSPPDRWAAVLDGVASRPSSAVTPTCSSTGSRPAHRVINPGSVGMPYGSPGACWAMLGPDVTLRQTGYDVAAAAAAIEASGYQDAREWADAYVRQHYSATEALAAFTEIAREQAI